MEPIKRPTYIKWLMSHRDKQVIKVISGLRGAGKSTILRLYADELRREGVGDDHILMINLEEKENSALLDEDALYGYVMERVPAEGTLYVMLDEIRLVPGFERVVDSLFVKENIDLCITVSDAGCLSSETGHRLCGRYVETNVLPLSFGEYRGFYGGTGESRRKLFDDYATYGAMPGTLAYGRGTPEQREYLEGVFGTVLENDVLKRNSATGRKTVENITGVLLRGTGRLTSAGRVTDTLASSGTRISYNTVSGYMEALCDCFLVYRAPRYDAVGKGYLRRGGRYYAADPGFGRILRGPGLELSQALENLVFLEFKRRRCRVATCKAGGSEVDFMVEGDDGVPRYVQVAETLSYGDRLEQELRPLLAIPDNYPKYIMTLDEWFTRDHDGVVTVNALDFLSGQEI